MTQLDLSALSKACERHKPGVPFESQAMPGGASTRRYYRITWDDGASAVGMFFPDGGTPEEIQKGHASPRWPFLEVRDLLAEHEVRVPKVFVEDTAHGWLLIEDLGDDTLANHLLRNPGAKPALYTQAVQDLAHAQKRLAKLPESCVVRTRAFDVDLLKWEIDHFREWGLEARGLRMSETDAAEFEAIGTRLAQRIAKMPYGFVHRDYQSRNLMVINDQIVWIDFQDALQGPRVYDLVALLNDSYQEFDRDFVEARLAEFAKAQKLSAKATAELVREFDLVTVQRKLKDAGRFVFIDRKKGNPSFLRFVSPTIRKVKEAVARLSAADEDMAALGKVLSRTLGAEFS
jgi:N-acetylmuramate 1-kinase